MLIKSVVFSAFFMVGYLSGGKVNFWNILFQLELRSCGRGDGGHAAAHLSPRLTFVPEHLKHNGEFRKSAVEKRHRTC